MKQLRITLLAGLILFILSGTVLTIFFLMERGSTAGLRRQDSFNRILREFDESFENLYLTETEMDRLNGELDKLEQRAISVESWLSILKRRRALSLIHSPSLWNYKKSINTALEIYPSSQPVIALGAACLVKDSPINRETEEKIRSWLPFVTDNAFNSLVLGLHVIMGDFNSPQKALALPASVFSDGNEDISMNLAILKTMRGDYQNAAAEIHSLVYSPFPSVNALRLSAEYHYDFGDLMRSADLFSLINDEKSMIRQADALYLAGFTDIASTIWSILAEFDSEISLYNLAVASSEAKEAFNNLEKLSNIKTVSNAEARQFGLIRYSRFLDYANAVGLLGRNINFSPEDYPYIDLEIAKRHSREEPLRRQIAQTWLLLERHDRNEELYKWACWHFYHQRSYDEVQILLDRLYIYQLTAPWIDVYRAVQYMNTGNLDMAEKILASIPQDEKKWYVHANLGRIFETSRSLRRALDQYLLAASLASQTAAGSRNEAKVQIRIAGCFSGLNNPAEARRALMQAIDLDPGNLTAQIELERILN